MGIMLNKKEVLFCAYLLDKYPNSVDINTQIEYRYNHVSRLKECINKLEKYGMIKITENNGSKILKLTLKGVLTIPTQIGFGVLDNDKDFNRFRKNAII
jgi:DNA-binding MarR family transcriptional regulator